MSALEIANGPGGFPSNAPATMNPFTVDSITLYERLLADGNHIAAVGSSDDHQGGGATGITDTVVGRGATVVHADQLSTQGIIAAVKAGHTYVKPFGADAPDVDLSATTPQGGKAIPGDSVTGSTLNVAINVKGASSAVRSGPYTLKLLQDGIEIDSVSVTGDDFSYSKPVTESGRYSFELTRPQGDQTMIEAYSTPVWFTLKPEVVPPSNAFSFGAFKANTWVAFLAATGLILGAAYALWLYRKVVFGALVKPSLMSIKDLTARECLTLFPLVVLTILFGVYPKPVLDMSAASVQQLVNNYNTAVTAVKAAALQ